MTNENQSSPPPEISITIRANSEDEFVKEVKNKLEPELNKLALKIWETHPNNPKNKHKIINKA